VQASKKEKIEVLQRDLLRCCRKYECKYAVDAKEQWWAPSRKKDRQERHRPFVSIKNIDEATLSL